jgi:hypothetical protein
MIPTRIRVGDEELVPEDPGALERLLGRPLVARDLGEMPSLAGLYAVQFEFEDYLVTMSVEQVNDGWTSSEPYWAQEVELHFRGYDCPGTLVLSASHPIKLVPRLEDGVGYTYQPIRKKESTVTHVKRIKTGDTLSADIETGKVLDSTPVQADVFLGLEYDTQALTSWLQADEAVELIRNLASSLGAEIVEDRIENDWTHGKLHRYDVKIDGRTEVVRIGGDNTKTMMVAQLLAIASEYLKGLEEERAQRKLEEEVDEFRMLRSSGKVIKPLKELTKNQRELHIKEYETFLEFAKSKLNKDEEVA